MKKYILLWDCLHKRKMVLDLRLVNWSLQSAGTGTVFTRIGKLSNEIRDGLLITLDACSLYQRNCHPHHQSICQTARSLVDRCRLRWFPPCAWPPSYNRNIWDPWSTQAVLGINFNKVLSYKRFEKIMLYLRLSNADDEDQQVLDFLTNINQNFQNCNSWILSYTWQKLAEVIPSKSKRQN